jgi:hypothetical protein
MTDSNPTEDSDGREPRVEQVKRWVAYIQTEPPETWGPQQNAVVNGQLDAAANAGLSASHRQRVREVADEILRANDDDTDADEPE